MSNESYIEERRRARRAGAGGKNIPEAHTLVRVHTLKDPLAHAAEQLRSGRNTAPVCGGSSYQQEREEAKMFFLTAKLALGTRSGYGIAWRQWTLFCKARQRDPWMLGRSPGEKRDDEELILDFIVHLAKYFLPHRRHGEDEALRGAVLPHLRGHP